MLEVEIRETACRGCQMCVDICPTEVFTFDEKEGKARVGEKEDCIGCLSCAYLCPSKAILHGHYHVVKNFYRDRDFCRRMGRFL
jgi:NAD-dependent dihydropyrimidine dehydrogenase PreA subunit